ncbi:DUF3800 domain-containing protein [Ekhidna sp.]
MKKTVDCKMLRETGIILNGLKDLDKPYTFFYDETNNIRRFYLKHDGFNVTNDTNFVIGGVLLEGVESTKIDTSTLFNGLNLQKSSNELKLKHLAKGDFVNCLKYDRLNYFLKWLYYSDLYIHYSNINLLYYSLVDIVDSAVSNSEEVLELGSGFIRMLKNTLYKVVMKEKEKVVQLFFRYQYPNIKAGMVRSFIEELTDIFNEYEDEFEFHIGLTSLKQILKKSTRNDSLPFIMDETDFVLLPDFFQFFLYPLYMFTNSIHFFDKEDTMEKMLTECEILDGDRQINSYHFIDSTDNKFIQISDVFIGLFGKYTELLTSKSESFLEKMVSQLSTRQLDTFIWFQNNIMKSNEKNQAFLHSVCSDDEIQKDQLICELLHKYSV